MLLAHIIQLTKICCNSETLIDIFRNALGIDSTSKNVIVKMSGHLTQSDIVTSTFLTQFFVTQIFMKGAEPALSKKISFLTII